MKITDILSTLNNKWMIETEENIITFICNQTPKIGEELEIISSDMILFRGKRYNALIQQGLTDGMNC